MNLPSTKFIQCQNEIRDALKSSPNTDVTSLWAATGNGTNIQYDRYKKTKQVLTAIRKDHEELINHNLTLQILSRGKSILKLSNLKVRRLWSTAQQYMPRNIFNFMIKYLNSTLLTKKNPHRWSLSNSPSCSFCRNVVSSCNSYRGGGRNFPTGGVDSSDEGSKRWFSGYYECQKSPKKSCFIVVVYFILSRLLYLAFLANLGLLCMPHPGMGPLV